MERNHMVQQLAAAASHPSFRHSILPGGLPASALGLQAHGSQRAQNFRVELAVPIQDCIAVRGGLRKRLPQLLDDQSEFGCGVTWKCKILRRACSITNKQYNTWKLTVGTVKKSSATMASR